MHKRPAVVLRVVRKVAVGLIGLVAVASLIAMIGLAIAKNSEFWTGVMVLGFLALIAGAIWPWREGIRRAGYISTAVVGVAAMTVGGVLGPDAETDDAVTSPADDGGDTDKSQLDQAAIVQSTAEAPSAASTPAPSIAPTLTPIPTAAPTSTPTLTPIPTAVPTSTPTLVHSFELASENDENMLYNDLKAAQVSVYSEGLHVSVDTYSGFAFDFEGGDRGYLDLSFWADVNGRASFELPDLVIEISGSRGTISEKMEGENVFVPLAGLEYKLLNDGHTIFVELPRILFDRSGTWFLAVSGGVPLKSPDCSSGTCFWYNVKAMPAARGPSAVIRFE